MPESPPDPLFTFHGDMKAVLCLYYRHIDDGNSLIYCGTESGFIHVWNTKMLRQVNTIKIGILPVTSILHYQNNFITQEKGGEIAMWNDRGKNWEKIKSFECDLKMFCKILLANKILVHPFSDCQIKLIEIDQINNCNNHTGIVSESNDKFGMAMCIKYIYKMNRILLSFENSSICLVNPDDGKFENVNKFNSDCPICIDYCDGSNFGIIGYSSNELIKFRINENNEIQKVKSASLINPGTSSVAIRNDGILFVVGTWDNSIKYFSSKTLKLLAVLTHHNLPIESLQFIPNLNNDSIEESYLLAGSRDGRVSLWNLYSK